MSLFPHRQIHNEWFWLSPNEIKDLADEFEQDDVYTDCKQYGKDRYVAKVLPTLNLSEDAKALLDKATEILKATMKFREVFDDSHPEYNINSWDCGWYQIKALAKTYAKNELDEFNKMYKEFETRMREGVVKFGFLYDVDGQN